MTLVGHPFVFEDLQRIVRGHFETSCIEYGDVALSLGDCYVCMQDLELWTLIFEVRPSSAVLIAAQRKTSGRGGGGMSELWC